MEIPTRFYRAKIARVLADIALIVCACILSAILVVGRERLLDLSPVFIRWLALAAFVHISTFILFGIYNAFWRYISFQDAFRLVGTILVSSAIMLPIWSAAHAFKVIPIKFFVIDSLLLIFLLSGARALRRILDERSQFKNTQEVRHRTLIYGAGNNGRTLARRFSTDSSLRMQSVGFLDDDPKKVGHTVAGIKVIGSRKDLSEVLKLHQIDDLVISISDLPGKILSEVIQVARVRKVRVHMLSDLGLHDRNTTRFDLFRNVELEDLLSRPTTRMRLESVKTFIQGKRVLITGAGGSIGSELARQIVGLEPSQLLLMESSEYNLYTIDSELRSSASETSFIIPLLNDLRDRQSLEDVITKYRPQIVFHAAAYKHVHLVELNPYSSIINNIAGTRNILELCQKINVETFLLISTDKAVNPIGVMGATKRVCEMMVADLGSKLGKRYCVVRFGNVVGSSGSLIPLLKKQINSGGPVTITHESMTRYFMLIREAVALVLKAASISRPGDISILRMGDPIRIVDIAKNLITLAGKTDEEIPIVYTGMRPGEKLHEELYLTGDELNTEHPDILVLPRGAGALEHTIFRATNGKSSEVFWAQVDRLIQSAYDAKTDAVGILLELVSPAKKEAEQAFERQTESSMLLN